MGIIAAAFPALALEVTVHQGGSGNYTTIAAAVAGTTAGDTIRVIDQGTYSDAFSLTDRILISDPAGAAITNIVTVTGGVSSSTSFTGFTFRNSVDGIRFFGDGPDYSPNIGQLSVTGCTFQNITEHGILLNFGNDGILTVSNSSFTNCAKNGITLWRNCQLTVSDSTFQSNGLGGSGDAGIFVDGDNNNALGRVISLSDVTFSGNLNGIKSWRRVDLTATDVTVTGNFLQGISVDGQGGGSTVTLTNSLLTSNNDRGLTMFRGMTANLEGTVIAGNGTYGIFMEDFGGGPDFGFPPEVNMKSCILAGNGSRAFTHQAKGSISSVVTVTSSFFSGGADRLLSGQAGTGKIRYTLERNIFRATSGSTIPVFAWNSDNQSRIAANLVDGGLVGVAINEGPMDAFNNTIVNSGAGALVVSNNTGGYTMNIHNNIVSQSGSGIRAAGDGTGFNTISVDYNLVHIVGGGSAIDPVFMVGSHNNVTDPPSFTSPSTTVGLGDYHLTVSSAARNAGDSNFVPATDLDGHLYNPSSPDLGPYTALSGVVDWKSY